MRHMQELVDSGLPLPAVHQVRYDTKSTWNRIAIRYYNTDRLASVYDPNRNCRILQAS